MLQALLDHKVTCANVEYQSVVHMLLQRLKEPTQLEGALKGATVAYHDFARTFKDPDVELRHTMVDQFSAAYLDCLQDFCSDVVVYTEGDYEAEVRSHFTLANSLFSGLELSHKA